MKMRYLVMMISLLSACKSYSTLPSQKFSQYEYYKSYTFENNQLKITLKNPLHCPLRIWIFNQNKNLQNELNQFKPIELEAKADTSIIIARLDSFDNNLNFASRLGSLNKKVAPIKLELPFPKNKSYTIIQGYQTNFTHNTDWSRYTLDFNFVTYDTICAATNGFVVGVIDKYTRNGEGDEWKPFANFVTIYEPSSGVFTQYVHLVENGSLVKVGDKVKSGQPIARSGNTGQSNVEHLHFSCLVPVNTNDGLKSIPFEFIEGYKGSELKKGDIVKK